MNKLWDWVVNTRPLTMKTVSQHVNIDNLTRWFLAVLFCATRDAYQGPGQFLDQRKETGGWFWVNWDMDQSFRSWDLDSYQDPLERVGEGRRGRNPAEPRSVILTHLIAEDAEFREYFKRAVQKAPTTSLTDAFLQERHQHDLDQATQLRVPNLDSRIEAQPVSGTATGVFSLDDGVMCEHLPSQRVTLSAPANIALIIDGERVANGYEGFYFPDLAMVVDVADEHRDRLVGWRVNGRLVPGVKPLSFTPDQPTRIEAVLSGSSNQSTLAANALVPAEPQPGRRGFRFDPGRDPKRPPSGVIFPQAHRGWVVSQVTRGVIPRSAREYRRESVSRSR